MITYTYRLTNEAESDTRNIYEWYENKLHGLGSRFFSHLEKALIKLHSILLPLLIQVF